MPGLDLFSLHVQADEALTKKVFKPNPSPIADPVPAARPQAVNGEEKLKVGYYAPDPVPAGMAHEFEAPAHHFSEYVVDPVPARSV